MLLISMSFAPSKLHLFYIFLSRSQNISWIHSFGRSSRKTRLSLQRIYFGAHPCFQSFENQWVENSAAHLARPILGQMCRLIYKVLIISLDFPSTAPRSQFVIRRCRCSVCVPVGPSGRSECPGFSAASPSCGKSWHLALRYLLLFIVMRQPFPEIRWSNGKYCSASKLQNLGLQGVMIEVCAFGLVAAARKAHLVFAIV